MSRPDSTEVAELRAKALAKLTRALAPKSVPTPLRVTDELRPCRRCKGPTVTRTARGAAVHAMCEGWLDRLTLEAEVAAVWSTALAMGASIDTTPAELVQLRRPITLRAGPCAWCGRPGLRITDDENMHCAAHIWPPYRWPPPDEG